MKNLTGWQRLGIVISGLWVLGLSGYAAYEYSKFPLDPFTTYTDSTYEMVRHVDTSKFYFIEVVKILWKDNNPEAARVLQKSVDDTSTEQSRQIAREVLTSYDYRSGLSSFFFVALLGGLFGFWGISYGGITLFHWIRHGFQTSKS